MVKKIIPMLMLMVSFMTMSCDKNVPFEGENQFRNGEYKMVVTQSGDVENFNISATFSGGNAVGSGIFNENGEDLGLSYYLSEKESKMREYTFKTAYDGTFITYALMANCANEKKKMDVEVKLYFNGEYLGCKKKSFKGMDSFPWSVTFAKMKE